MRALGPALLVSLGLWAALAWCFVVLRMLIGTDHMHLDAQDLGAWLLGIDLVFLVAVLWLGQRLAALPD